MALDKYVRARSLAAALALPAGVALGAMVTAVPVTRAQELEWATQAGGGGYASYDSASAIATDSSGNSYITGYTFQATFGAGEPNETEISRGTFVAKYDRRGRLVWATRAGDNDDGTGIATDRAGNSYLTGNFYGTTTFGEGEPNETTLTSAGGLDIFVAKYDRKGRFLWATQAGGNSYDTGYDIATDIHGNSYVTGIFARTATFGAGEPNETELTAAGFLSENFVAKYDRRGQFLWAKRAGGLRIATDIFGNSYVTGTFYGTKTFGAGEPNETELTAAGDSHFCGVDTSK